MTVRACMVQNIGKFFKVVTQDGFIIFNGRATRDMIDMSVDKPWMHDEVSGVEYGRSHDADGARAVVVVTIE